MALPYTLKIALSICKAIGGVVDYEVEFRLPHKIGEPRRNTQPARHWNFEPGGVASILTSRPSPGNDSMSASMT
jgi:hypothetical protein